MKHFKLSKELTLGQNLTALVLILSYLAIFSPTHKAQAGWADLFGSSEKEDACEKVEKGLDEKLREMAGACSSTNMGGGCLQSIFTCNEENADLEECQSFASTTSLPTKDGERQRLDEQKDELKALEKKKEAIQDRQEIAQKDVDDLNSKYEDKVREIEALDTELESELNNSRNEVAAKLAAIQAGNKELEAQSDSIFAKVLEQKKQMVNFMTTERLVCGQEAKVAAQKFYSVMRGCMSGRANCTVSLNTLVSNGRQSLAEMTKSYERKQARKCLRVDGFNDFSIKYRAMQASVKIDESALLAQQNKIAKARAELTNQITLAQANGQLSNAQATARHAKSAQILSTEKARLQSQITAKAEAIKNHVAEVKAVQDEIDTQNSDISNTRESLSSSVDGKDLNKLRESQLIADSLVSEAKYSFKNNSCPCSGAIKNISDYSGQDFCGSSSEIETSDVEVDLENVDATAL